MGGSKVSTKIGIIENLMDKVDNLILCGGMTFTFAKAQGGKIGNSICEDDKLQLALDIIAKAKAEAAAIVAEAQAKAKETLEAAKETAPAAPKPNDLVPIRLFKDNDKYKDDVFVAVNGRSFQIKRGETVQVPAYVAEVLEQSMAQDNATANLIERESSAYAAEAKARNI